MSDDGEPVLTAGKVASLFRDCLAGAAGGDGIAAKGIVRDAVFNPRAVEAHRDDIRALLAELPDQFRKSGGGGWSFLNACNDRHGNLWAGLHATMEELFLLGMAAGLAADLLGPAARDVLPGGMPYYVVDM